MSVYTNDVDTLRQMLSQSIPQLMSSAITIVSVFVSMCMLDMPSHRRHHADGGPDALLPPRRSPRQSGKYFIAQQRDLGKAERLH